MQISPDQVHEAVAKVFRKHLPLMVEEVVQLLNEEQGLASPAPEPQKGDVRLPSADVLFRAAREGGEADLSRLLDLSLPRLHGVVGLLGLDPSRKVRKWKDPEKVRNFIVEEILRRLQRNAAFLPSDYRPQATSTVSQVGTGGVQPASSPSPEEP